MNFFFVKPSVDKYFIVYFGDETDHLNQLRVGSFAEKYQADHLAYTLNNRVIEHVNCYVGAIKS